MSETPFMKAVRARNARDDGRKSIHLASLDLTVFFRPATLGEVRRALRDCGPKDEIKMTAILVRDLCQDEAGQRLFPEGDDGLRFILEEMRAADMEELGRALKGETADDAGND